MKKYLIFFVTIISLFLYSVNLNAQTLKKDYKGIGFWALDKEKESGFEVSDEAYLLLDSIVNECKFRIKIKTNYNFEETLAILNIIGSVIKSYNIKYDTLKLYSEALEKRMFDCKFSTLTYLTISENISLQLYSMLVYKHVFIDWKNNDNEIYWETTYHWMSSKLYYIDSLKIPEKVISSLGYFNSMDNNQSQCIVYFYLGIAKDNLNKDYTGAIDDFNKALEIKPMIADAYYNRGRAKYNLKDYQGAIFDYDTAIEINPNYAEAYNNRGGAKRDLGKFQDAIRDLNKAIEINHELAQAYYNRGNSKYDLGDKLESIADFDTAIKINPMFSDAYNNRGLAKYKLDDKQGAIDDYNIAIELNPQFAGAYYNRGLAKYNLGNKQDGCLDFKKAGELGIMKAKDLINKYCK